MLSVNIETSALLKLAKTLSKKQAAVSVAAARALNNIGNEVVEEVIQSVMEQTGLDDAQVRKSVSVTRATRENLNFRINASKALIEEPETRPMAGRRQFTRRPDTYFRQNELVNIVSMGDDKVCMICQDLEENSPYTIEEARAHIPAHPHCRCLVQNARQRRDLPVEIKKGEKMQISVVTKDRLAKALKDELKIVLRAR
jgi:HEAT repeat protein